MTEGMKERPIIMTAESVRAILEGRKTQTRRVIKPQPEPDAYGWVGMPGGYWPADADGSPIRDCYGVPGDRLWVKEAWGIGGSRLVDPCLNYRADSGQLPLIGNSSPDTWCLAKNGGGSKFEVNDADLLAVKDGWRNALFMPRWASRLTLEITDVRVQRLQDMDYLDAYAEGIPEQGGNSSDGAWRVLRKFEELWDSINAKKAPWASNPWCWAITFKRV